MGNKKHKYYEKVSFIAFEGSSLTLMGLVKYDAKTDQLRMTDVSGFVAGGFKECKKLIMKEINEIRAIGRIFGILTGVCGLVCGLILYSSYSEWRMKQILRERHAA